MDIVEGMRRRLRRSGFTIIRRWYVAGFAVAAMLPVVYLAHIQTGVYYTSVNVIFLAPPQSVGGNSLRASSAKTVYYAAMIDRLYNGQNDNPELSTTSSPLYGTGVRHGAAVYVPNNGGQWQNSFDQPVITVEVVGESGAEVTGELGAVVAKIGKLARQPQQSMGIHSNAYITTDLSPQVPNVTYVAVRNRNAELALGVLTVGLAIGLPQIWDRILRAVARRRRRYVIVRPLREREAAMTGEGESEAANAHLKL
ncbi:hypothetical protein [Arthrobacter dokdonensis]|uniref:hypothetical protein n=1 Tax=Arthrobacter dokdonellae TaxID=2211210 RepID=UPI000DE5A72A|nr:hypothetical protein [Arthrobacter dokdonellae]